MIIEVVTEALKIEVEDVVEEEEEEEIQKEEEEASLIERREKKVHIWSAKYARELAIMRMGFGLKESHNATIVKKLGIWLRIVGSGIYKKLLLCYGKEKEWGESLFYAWQSSLNKKNKACYSSSSYISNDDKIDSRYGCINT